MNSQTNRIWVCKVTSFSLAAILMATGGDAAGAATASKSSTTEKAGTAVALAVPLAAGVISLYKQDREGVVQLVLDTALTVGTAYGLKQIVREQRPDHSNFGSFPSNTAAIAFAPAQYLWQRYGWEYGVPAYAAAGFVGYSRVDANKHHWWDVAASAGLSLGYNALITTRFKPQENVATALQVTPGSVLLSANLRW